MDLIYSTGYKGIEFKRTMAVANGDPCCDYRYIFSLKTRKN